MEKKKVIELIKLEVLDGLNDTDAETLRMSKETDAEFPWKELGDYQNLAAMLPLALKLEFPAGELKDKVALKLYNMRDEIKAKLEAKRIPEEPSVVSMQEDEIPEEEIFIEEKPVPQEIEQPPVTIAEKIEQKRLAEEAKADLRSKVTFDKELVEKSVREYYKLHYENQLQAIRQDVKRNFIVTLALFVISLIAIIAVFLAG